VYVCSWLGEAHREYDTDYLLHVRATALEVKYRAGDSGRSFFSTLQIGSGSNVIKSGDIIRLYPKKARGNALDKSNEIYGRIITFASHKLLSADVTVYNGKASILYVREPCNVYGDEAAQIEAMMDKDSLLALPLNAIVLRNNTFVKVTQTEMKETSQAAVKSAKIFLIENVGDTPVEIVELSKQGIQTTQKFSSMGIQLFNALGKQVISPPQSGNSQEKRYKTSLLLKTPADTQKEFGECSGSTIFFYSEKEKRDIQLKTKDLAHVSYFYYYCYYCCTEYNYVFIYFSFYLS